MSRPPLVFRRVDSEAQAPSAAGRFFRRPGYVSDEGWRLDSMDGGWWAVASADDFQARVHGRRTAVAAIERASGRRVVLPGMPGHPG